jgi:hypothetical protein
MAETWWLQDRGARWRRRCWAGRHWAMGVRGPRTTVGLLDPAMKRLSCVDLPGIYWALALGDSVLGESPVACISSRG